MENPVVGPSCIRRSAGRGRFTEKHMGGFFGHLMQHITAWRRAEKYTEIFHVARCI